MVNKVIIIGHVGKDPEVRYTGNASNGAKVAQLRVATTERYKDKDGNIHDITEWHSVVLWRQLADIVEKYVKKGSQVYVEGKLQTRSWDDNAGVKRHVTDIIANTLQILGKKDLSNSQQPVDPYVEGARQMAAQQDAKTQVIDDKPDDDLTF